MGLLPPFLSHASRSRVFQIKTRIPPEKNAKVGPAPRGTFSTVENVNGHFERVAKINTQEKKGGKPPHIFENHFLYFTCGPNAAPNTFVLRLLDFCQFPQLCLIC